MDRLYLQSPHQLFFSRTSLININPFLYLTFLAMNMTQRDSRTIVDIKKITVPNHIRAAPSVIRIIIRRAFYAGGRRKIRGILQLLKSMTERRVKIYLKHFWSITSDLKYQIPIAIAVVIFKSKRKIIITGQFQ